MNMNKINFNYSSNDYTEQSENIMIGEEKNKFVITPLGIKTTEYLLGYFKNIMDYNFTADMENSLSLIADGQDTYYQTMKFFYDILKQNLDEADKDIVEIRTDDDIVIGKYEGKDVLLKDGRYGLYMVCNKNKCTLSGIELTKEQIMNGGLDQKTIKKLFDDKLHPENNAYCFYKDKPVLFKNGRYGEYINWNGKNISIPPIFDKTEENVINLIKSKEPVKEFECGTILNGPYGVYIKDKTNPRRMVSIPADLDIDTIDEAKAKELLDSWSNKFTKKTGAKKSGEGKKTGTGKKTGGRKKADNSNKASESSVVKKTGTGTVKKTSGNNVKKTSGTSAVKKTNGSNKTTGAAKKTGTSKK